MSKRCPSCGQINEDGRIFRSACGDPLSACLRLIQNMEQLSKTPRREAPAVVAAMGCF